MEGSRFTVSAQRGADRRTDTRVSAASALVLADRWAAEGWNGILVTNPNGVESDRETFRATLPLARWLRRPGMLHRSTPADAAAP